MHDLEAVGLIGSIVECVQFVNGNLMEAVKVGPPFPTAAEIVVQIGICALLAQFGSHIESTHGQNIDAVAGDGAESGGNGFHNTCMDAGALAGCNVDTHAGAAENHGTLKFLLGDHGTDTQADSVEHQLGVIGVGIGLYTDIGDGPTLVLQILFDGFFQGIACKIGSHEQLLVFYHFHIWFLLMLSAPDIGAVGADDAENLIQLYHTSRQDTIANGKYLLDLQLFCSGQSLLAKCLAVLYNIEKSAKEKSDMSYRVEHDSMGEVLVPTEKYWGAQTQRSRENFPIGVGREPMPTEIIRAFGILKKAAAQANRELRPEKMTEEKLQAITAACDEIIGGKLDEHFPLVVWQTGSGTQTNMNANEVIANRGSELAGKKLLHPNDDVNMSQSSNDTFPTAMHIAAVLAVEDRVLPAVEKLTETLVRLEREHAGVVKSGRTHLQDATPIAFSQEISGWRTSLERDCELLQGTLPHLKELALGGTAVGTGLNAPQGFAETVAAKIAAQTGKNFVTAPNKFHALTSRDELVFAHGGLKALAADLMKIANDIRWMASGPRLGLGEIFIPENEPGSSIMPGKVNPTQCEAVTMVAVQVMGNDAAMGIAASQGNFELNVFLPVMAYNFLQSARLLADAVESFCERCVSGIRANRQRMHENLHNSLMLVTALNPYIGYENAAKTAKLAYRESISLKEACLRLGFLSAEEFDRVFRPEDMV